MEPPINQNQQLNASCSSTTQTKEQAQKMITDLWGAMMALFGDKWTRSYGEQVDKTGQWLLTLNGVSRQQIAAALSEIRVSGRAWPPVAPEFRAMCLAVGKEKTPPLEICYVEVQEFVRNGRRDTHNLSPFSYHVVVKNLDFYNYKKLEKEYERVKAFEIAYKATLFQLESGQELITPPAPETLIEQKKPGQAETTEPSFQISDLLKLFEDPPKDKTLTPEEILDKQKLERFRGNHV